ncbi:MAG: PIG-L family deacetylase [Gammaproteobacteria bacterium]|uniref:PIG-L deacetylase family protein n=1 Tax=Rhodoferax sp. TaxID=50421 RepID=UPI0017CE77BC|nr:PIG-L family deacetylase [Rhodoferax sp.]MBU3900965.1 PIG-L family deacetylase [Gammaproteobacteria bacterium]MBA3056474.1 PIG-L family deacetylase [Rhodoferax sp.]MBU3996806.1 PIG-L family deacetylase [Gammaproteobacteria bacterium]MBU4017639.1 PIG-L family deacetylase [Gammaproteobacteria bacterium]MBU4081082.1 PIG-L family deacetylase [Gammaproteobacteria bacterium]
MKTLPLLDRFNWHDFERVVILSPHLDDAALSCGGLLHALQERVSTLVVSISCGSLRVVNADGSSKISTRRGHVSSRSRRREDIAAMHSVDTDFVHLSFADGVYRRSPLTGRLIYRNTRERWVLPRIEDLAHVEELYLVLRRLCLDLGRILLISPMGIGHHVDHQIAAQVAVRMAATNAGAELLFYEDFPYVADPHIGRGDQDDPLQALTRLHLAAAQRLVMLVDVDAKMALLRHYASQVPALFGNDEGMRARLAGHLHGTVPCEYYWQAQTLPATYTSKEKSHVE